MKERCLNPNAKSYHNYGGRGIKICPEWLESFQNFIDDIGLAPSEKHSLGRIDNNKDYCKENCRWETWEQQHFNKQDTIYVEYKGERRTLKSVLDERGIKYNLNIPKRLRKGMPLEEAITKPNFKPKKHLVDGKYLTTREITKKYNIKRETFEARIRLYGMSSQDAATFQSNESKRHKPSPKRKFYDIFGEQMSLVDIEKKYGIKGSVFRKRLKTGWDLEKALTVKTQGRAYVPPKIFEIDGEKYSISQLAKKYSIKAATIRKRIHDGMSIEEAINKPIDDKKIEIYGEKLTGAELEAKYNISRKQLWTRINVDGWSLEEALTIPVKRRKKT